MLWDRASSKLARVEFVKAEKELDLTRKPVAALSLGSDWFKLLAVTFRRTSLSKRDRSSRTMARKISSGYLDNALAAGGESKDQKPHAIG